MLDLEKMKSSLLKPELLTAPEFDPNAKPLYGARIVAEDVRFYRIVELSADHAEVLRQSMENVISGLVSIRYRWIYCLLGTSEGIELYLGVVRNGVHDDELSDHGHLLQSLVKGNLVGAEIMPLTNAQVEQRIFEPLQKSSHIGLVQGIPSKENPQHMVNSDRSAQGIERLIDSLMGEQEGQVWQMVMVSEAVSAQEVQQLWYDVLQLGTELTPFLTSSEQSSNQSAKSKSSSQTKGTSLTHGITDGESTAESRNEGSNTSKSTATTKSKGEQGSKTESSSSGTIQKTTGSNNSTQTQDTQGSGTQQGSSQSKTTSKQVSKNEASTKSDTDSTQESSTLSSTRQYSTTNKMAERIADHLQKWLLPRIEQGRTEGLFKTAIYLASPHKRTYQHLASTVKGLFQTHVSAFSPLTVTDLGRVLPDQRLSRLLGLLSNPINPSQVGQSRQHHLLHSRSHQAQGNPVATYLTTPEIALMAGLPTREVPGLRLRHQVDFALNVKSPEDGVVLGHIVQHGRELRNQPVRIDRQLLNQHIFVAGVTGSGKTTTCQRLLLDSGLPFLVIEPAKTEYRVLMQNLPDLQIYALGNEQLSTFRFNPFELLPGEQLSGHIDMLKATFIAVFPMEASMPYLIEEAVVRSYEAKGWDILDNSNADYPDPWQCQGQCWPTLSEMLDCLKKVIAGKKFAPELQQNYEGSLISRLDNLTLGIKGRMLNSRNSIDLEALLDQKVVIELDELRDEQDKALLMGLLIGRLAEAMKQRHHKQPQFRHLTLIEEAHRLLGRPEGHEGAKRSGIALFANLLAEVRKYGEGLIIADQIPNQLTPEVLKNTNTKIIHRLFAADDRHAIGDTVSLNRDQKDFLTYLQTGEVVMYSAGWHQAVRVQVQQSTNTTGSPIEVQRIADQSTQRLWAHRQRLYPHTAALSGWMPEDFARAVRGGYGLLQQWLRWWSGQPNRLATRMQLFRAEHEDRDVPALLTALCLDELHLQPSRHAAARERRQQALLRWFTLPIDLLGGSCQADAVLNHLGLDHDEVLRHEVF